jgi:hypothetical protein
MGLDPKNPPESPAPDEYSVPPSPSGSQPDMRRDRQDPYPSDQAFGAAAARDQDRVDAGEAPETDAHPRAGTKAEPDGPAEPPGAADAEAMRGEAPTG